MPKVSILMPVYKVDKYLRQSIDSVINQTLKDIEIIIVDEGEMDKCRAIIDEYEAKDSRIKTIHEQNGSYGIALNKAFNIATGEYVGIVESDDFIDKEMYEDLYNLAKKFDADVAKSDWYNYHTENNKSYKSGLIPAYKTNKITNTKEDASLLKIQPSVWSAIYKRSFLNDNHIRFINKPKHFFQDTSFTFKVFALAQRIVLTTKAYVHYRIDSEGSTCNSRGRIFAICDEFKEITDFLNAHKDLKEYLNSRKLISEYNAYMWNLRRISKELRPEFIERFSQIFKEYYDNNEFDNNFYKKISHKDLDTLINNPDKFEKIVNKKILSEKIRNFRKKFLTIRINSSRAYICLFGKTILEVG